MSDCAENDQNRNQALANSASELRVKQALIGLLQSAYFFATVPAAMIWVIFIESKIDPLDLSYLREGRQAPPLRVARELLAVVIVVLVLCWCQLASRSKLLRAVAVIFVVAAYIFVAYAYYRTFLS